MEVNKNLCFFCSREISEKKSKEHIIPDSLLGKLGIKNKTLTGRGEFTYSRLKVPAHAKCNSEFGSRYESEILEYLDYPDRTYETLTEEEKGIAVRYGPDDSTTSKISTWLLKIYYGIFYNDYLKVKDEEWKQISLNIIDTVNFNLVRESYKRNYGFYLPSSLYVFKTNNSEFNLRTFIFPQTILMQVEGLVFILNICDGFLVKNYLNESHLSNFRRSLKENESENDQFPSGLFACAELVALRMCIPKSPMFIFNEGEVINLSLSTSVENPEEHYKIDNDLLNKTREEVLLELGIKVKKLSRTINKKED